MKIVPLEEESPLANIVHSWIKNEWGDLNILNYFEHIIENKEYRSQLPRSLVAISSEGEAMGTISILLDDMDIKSNLNPWLGCLFVAKKFRKKSVARALFASCEVMASELNIETIYLFTSKIEHLAYQSGWVKIENVYFENETVTVMSKKIG